jgi:hypothetical protein
LFIIVLEAMTDLSAADLLLLSVVNTTNILTFFIFISRVKWPNAVSKLAIATILMAIPAIVIASLNKTADREWPYWVMPLVLVAWAVLALVVDIVRKEEFRQPRNTKILVPFLLLFYIGLGGMGALTWRTGFSLWALTAATFTLQFVGMAYAFRHGKG